MNKNHAIGATDVNDWKYKVVMWLVWHLPRRFAYWATIRVATWDYDGNPGERTVADALSAWGVAKR